MKHWPGDPSTLHLPWSGYNSPSDSIHISLLLVFFHHIVAQGAVCDCPSCATLPIHPPSTTCSGQSSSPSAALLNRSGTYCCPQKGRLGIVWAFLPARLKTAPPPLVVHTWALIGACGVDEGLSPSSFRACLPTRRNTLRQRIEQHRQSLIPGRNHCGNRSNSPLVPVSTKPDRVPSGFNFPASSSSFADRAATFLLHKRTYHDRQSCPAHKYCVAHVPHHQVTRQTDRTIFNLDVVDLVS